MAIAESSAQMCGGMPRRVFKCARSAFVYKVLAFVFVGLICASVRRWVCRDFCEVPHEAMLLTLRLQTPIARLAQLCAQRSKALATASTGADYEDRLKHIATVLPEQAGQYRPM